MNPSGADTGMFWEKTLNSTITACSIELIHQQGLTLQQLAHAQWTMGWNYLYIPKPLGLKLIQVSERSPLFRTLPGHHNSRYSYPKIK